MSSLIVKRVARDCGWVDRVGTIRNFCERCGTSIRGVWQSVLAHDTSVVTALQGISVAGRGTRGGPVRDTAHRIYIAIDGRTRKNRRLFSLVRMSTIYYRIYFNEDPSVEH